MMYIRSLFICTMKKLLTLLSFIIAFTTVQSQVRSCDLQATLVSPIDYDFVQTLNPKDYTIKIKNLGPNVITTKDTIIYTLIYDGDTVISGSKPLQKAYAGYSIPVNGEATEPVWQGLQQFYNTGGVHIYCMGVKLLNRSTTGASDPVSTNNSSCHHVYVNIYTAGVDTKNETDKNKPVMITPNPANTNATLSYAVITNADVKLAIIDMQGREVIQVLNQTQAIGVYEKSVDLSHLDAGIYFVRYTNGGNVYTSKLVKQ
jgi:hypothetical protein